MAHEIVFYSPHQNRVFTFNGEPEQNWLEWCERASGMPGNESSCIWVVPTPEAQKTVASDWAPEVYELIEALTSCPT